MNSFRFNRLERHRVGREGGKMVLSIPVPRTASGKVYQYSPNPDAAPRLFLIGDALRIERSGIVLRNARMRSLGLA